MSLSTTHSLPVSDSAREWPTIKVLRTKLRLPLSTLTRSAAWLGAAPNSASMPRPLANTCAWPAAGSADGRAREGRLRTWVTPGAPALAPREVAALASRGSRVVSPRVSSST